jgi:hypothetical protein
MAKTTTNTGVFLAGFAGAKGAPGDAGPPGIVMGFPHREQGPDCPAY